MKCVSTAVTTLWHRNEIQRLILIFFKSLDFLDLCPDLNSAFILIYNHDYTPSKFHDCVLCGCDAVAGTKSVHSQTDRHTYKHLAMY